MKVIQTINSHWWNVLMVVLFYVLGFASCTDPETTDKTGFNIYYLGMSDIGPGQSGTIAQPTYKGPVPTNFAITGVTLDGEPFNGDLFVIDGHTGVVSVNTHKETKTGLYSLSISCEARGSVHSFCDIIQVTVLNAVPEGIVVEPNTLAVEYADIISDDNEIELPTALVKTDKNHISITGYKIVNVYKNNTFIDNVKDPLFKISSDGIISIVKGCDAVSPGAYVIDLKLNTAISGSNSEEGLYKSALTVNVTSKPLQLTYQKGKIEEATSECPVTSFVSQNPELKGSTDGAIYSIESVYPSEATSVLSIDSQSGVISVKEGHGLKKGQKIEVNVRVSNDYCKEGVVFDKAFRLDVVDYIAPIANFKYEEVQATQAVQFKAVVANGMTGAEPRFEFVDLAPQYEDELKLDTKNGTISASKGNSLGLGEHKIQVKASNDKNELVTTLVINVKKNLNYFSYLTYGNNLNLDEKLEASQFRVRSEEELKKLKLLPKHDIPSDRNVEWKMVVKNQMKDDNEHSTIDSKTGKIKALGLKENTLGVVYVTATVYGKSVNEPEAYSITIPVCFHHAAPLKEVTSNKKVICENGVSVEYTPFVFRVNPKVGGRSVKPKITGVSNMSKFVLDYRRTFNYYNLKGYRSEGNGKEFEDGTPSTSPFLNALWTSCESSPSSKDAVSYFNKKGVISTLCYVDNSSSDFSVVVNPNKWNSEGWADGLFHAQMTCITNGEARTDLNNGAKIFPLIIWLDKSMK